MYAAIGIWWGCGSRGSRRVWIQSLWRKGISAFPLVKTEVKIPFGLWMLAGFGTGTKLFLSFLLIPSVDFCLGLVFGFCTSCNLFIEYACYCFGASCNLVLFLLQVKYCCYTDYWLSVFGITVHPRYCNCWLPSFWNAGLSWTCYKDSRQGWSSLPE